MKIQISFTHDSKRYKFTIDENDIDMGHYDDLWDWWVSENENELNDRSYVDKDENFERVFEITAHKMWLQDTQKEVISGNGVYVNVYSNADAFDADSTISTEDIEVLYL